MLPSYHSFDRVGLCGNSGTVVVKVILYRLTIKIIHTCSPKKSTIARAKNQDSKSHSYGFYYSV